MTHVLPDTFVNPLNVIVFVADVTVKTPENVHDVNVFVPAHAKGIIFTVQFVKVLQVIVK